MKKILLFILMLLVMPLSVDAANRIYNMDINIDILEDGSANITEVWDIDGEDGTEWYKVMNNLGNSRLSNFTVFMDGRELVYKEWDVNESLSQKRGYYGINYTGDGLELCFGKYDYARHKFTLKYTLSNFVFNTNDSQVLYFKLIDRLSSVDFENFSVTISSYYDFPNTLDVWGYGYKGYAYIESGKIKMSNEDDGNMNGNFVVLLVKFPLNTFRTLNSYDRYDSFDTVYNIAQDGTFEYDYEEEIDEELERPKGFIYFILNILFNLTPFFIIFLVVKLVISNGYGYKDNKIINKNNVPMFRDIPCNKDIYYANTLIKLNNFGYHQSNILGAIILKWIRTDMVVFKNEKMGVFNKETSVIDLTKEVTFDNELEEELFKMMRAASKDGFLETRELEKWSRKNYEKFLGLFTRIENKTINTLKTESHIYSRVDKKECKMKNVMDDQMYYDSVQLYGLKKYLKEFSRIDTKEAIEVKLWDEYLMFAYLFGIADKVAKQFKNMYPEIIEQMQAQNFDYNTLVFVNYISTKSVSAASGARAAAENYSSGGGGFASGGGGGGSFGGGGGGSR